MGSIAQYYVFCRTPGVPHQNDGPETLSADTMAREPSEDRRSLRLDGVGDEHAGVNVIGDVAVMQPCAGIVGHHVGRSHTTR